MKEIRVSNSKTYDVIIERGILKDAGRLILDKVYHFPDSDVHKASGEAKVFVMPHSDDNIHKAPKDFNASVLLVSDDNVYKIYGDEVKNSLLSSGFKLYPFIFPQGENSKCMELYEKLINFIGDMGIKRSDILVALGGGVSGDLGGFAASTYMRGIKLLEIPTTLIAMSDSSVGGKNGINLSSGKNLCGTFYQPELVICDTEVLDTLPREVFLDGCAEVIKYGLIESPGLLHHLEEKSLDFDREYVISECVRMKRDIVDEDEFDLGKRRLLNLGHTVGHALEKLSNFSLSHGMAVAKGISVIAFSSMKYGLCGEETLDKIIRLLKKFGFDLTIPYGFDEIMGAILSDKKRLGANITWIAVTDYGKSAILTASIEEFKSFLRPGIPK